MSPLTLIARSSSSLFRSTSTSGERRSEFLHRQAFFQHDRDRLLARGVHDRHLGVEKIPAEQDVKSIGSDGAVDDAVQVVDLVLPAAGDLARSYLELRRSIELIVRALAP